MFTISEAAFKVEQLPNGRYYYVDHTHELASESAECEEELDTLAPNAVLSPTLIINMHIMYKWYLEDKRFRELCVTNTNDRSKKTIKIEASVPGVNSGAYTRALHIQVWIAEETSCLGIKSEKRSNGTITLTPNQILQLRAECDKILALKE